MWGKLLFVLAPLGHFPAFLSSMSQTKDETDETPTPLGSGVKRTSENSAIKIGTLQEHLKNIKINEKKREGLRL